MDGQVDQVYECKNQTCERQYQVVNGKPQRLVRTIAGGPEETIEIYEDKQGQLQLIQRTRNLSAADYSGTQTEGEFCFNCYDKNYSQFTELLDQFEALQRSPVPRRDLAKIDDFYVSRVGVLIHEECFDNPKYDFDIEKAVTDAVVQGMSCQVNLTSDSDQYLGTKGQTYYSHIPRLVNLFTNSSRVDDGLIVNGSDGPQLLSNPCEDYKNFQVLNANQQTVNIGSYMNISDNCQYVPEVELGVPKVICQRDQFVAASELGRGQRPLADASSVAYGSGPHNKHPTYVNYKSKTKVYNYPVVAFTSNGSLSEVQFKSTLWHEMMHNCGYTHSDHSKPDYAYMCEVACFGSEYKSFDSEKIGDAARYCVSDEKNREHDGVLKDFRRALNF